MDRLVAAVHRHATPLCVGLDPRPECLPQTIRDEHPNSVRACEEFCCRVIDISAKYVGVVKPQSAFFERWGAEGFAVLRTVLRRAKEQGLFTILDAKRGDISTTAAAYAEAAFDYFDADAVTVNPYLGRDSVEPFIKAARERRRGVFVLVRTSNPGAGAFQDLVCEGKPLYRHVAEAVETWSGEHRNSLGYGDVGAVVGATRPVDLRALRAVLPSAWLLVPGYGVQGAGAADVAGAFQADGLGAVVNSSRGVVFPFRPEDRTWETKIEQAMRRCAAELQTVARRSPDSM
jgi:orotidine-5'-phosphate decarboxylase